MKKISLTQGKFAIVDDEDFESVNQYKWLARVSNEIWYAARGIRNGKKTHLIHIHRFIMGLDSDNKYVIDHINHDGLDNRKINLRICTQKENTLNRRPKQISSTRKGVGLDAKNKKWRSFININQIYYHLGYFDTENEAGKMYDKVALAEFGEFACVNFPRESYKKEDLITIKEILKARLENKTCNFVGVHKVRSKYRSSIRINKKLIHLGYFKNDIDAGKAYDSYIIKNKLNRKLNFPQDNK